MTTIEKFIEIEVKVWKYEAVCYWCAIVFNKIILNKKKSSWKEHINIEHESKFFCSKECHETWIEYKSVFGDLLP